MKKRGGSNSTIGIIITIVIVVFPLTQIILLTLNGGLTYIFAIPFGAKTKSGITEISSIAVNSILIILGLIGFYLTRKTWVEIITAFLIMFSGQMLMSFISDDFSGGDNYFLGWLTVSVVPILAIIFIAIAKFYIRDKKKNAVY